MRRKLIISLLCVFIIACFSGCNGAHEIDDYAYPLIIGVDKGVTDVFRFTFEFPTVKGPTGASGGGGSGSSQPQGSGDYSTVSVDCSTLNGASNIINASLSRIFNFMHTKYLIISEELAKEGVERFLNGIIRNYQVRRFIQVIVVKGSAMDFINSFKPIIGISITRTQELMLDMQNIIGLFEEMNYNRFFADLKGGYSQPAAALAALSDFSNFEKKASPQVGFKSPFDYYAGEFPRKGGNKYEFTGTAIFNGDKMVGELNGDETRCLLMITNQYKSASVVIPDPMDSKLRVSADIHPKKAPKVKVSFQDGKPVIDVKVFLEGELQNLQGTTDYESPKMKPVLENAYKAFIKNQMDKTIEKCKELNSEQFYFGEKAARHFLTIEEWEDYNWISHFKEATVTTDVEFVIVRTGTLMKTSKSVAAEGKEK